MSTKLGSKVTDRVTGIVGTATARCELLYGSAQIKVEFTADPDGKAREPLWFDEGRISHVVDEPPAAEANVTRIDPSPSSQPQSAASLAA